MANYTLIQDEGDGKRSLSLEVTDRTGSKQIGVFWQVEDDNSYRWWPADRGETLSVEDCREVVCIADRIIYLGFDYVFTTDGVAYQEEDEL
jgi:hypothetical protein